MEYLYEVYNVTVEPVTRVDTTTKFEDLERLFENKYYSFHTHCVHVCKLTTDELVDVFNSEEDMAGHRQMLERRSWGPKMTIREIVTPTPVHGTHMHVEDDGFHIDSIQEVSAINPPHYQDFMVVEHGSYQWLEVMCRVERYRNNPNEFIAALELQVRKYIDRRGKKDADLQEAEKGLWYHKFMVAYIKNGCKPIYVRDIEAILARK